MRNLLKREAIIFTLTMVAVFFASKTLVDKQGVDFFEAIVLVMNRDDIETKSIDWFVKHPVDTQRQMEQCHKEHLSQTSKNCWNADYAYQIYKQIKSNKAF